MDTHPTSRKLTSLPQATAEQLHCLVPTTRSLDATAKGPLSGRTFVVKDLMSIRGHVSSFGHPRWRETHDEATDTASVVDRLLAAGASMVGLTKMDQLAYSLIGNVGEGEAPANPFAPDRFTGGSSSGSASAVAGGLADVGVGTDTAGSIRVPASACGLFGIRPTHGAVDSKGVIALAQSFDVVGLLARDARVLTAFYSALTGRTANDHKRIGAVLVPADALCLVDESVGRAVRGTATAVGAALGCPVREVAFGQFIDAAAGDTLARLQGREIWKNHAAWIEANGMHLNEDVRTRLGRCKQWSLSTEGEKAADLQTRQRYIDSLHELVRGECVIVMPIMRDSTPRRISTLEEQKTFRLETFRLVAPGSLCGVPQVVLPVRERVSGRCFGISLLGGRGGDFELLAAAVAVAAGRNSVEV